MNSVEDDVGLDYKLYKQRSVDGFISANDGSRNSYTIEKISFGKTIVDRLDYEYEQNKIQYFQLVGESQKITYNNKKFTTKNQKHYLWKLEGTESNNIYNSQLKTFVKDSGNSNYDEIASKMIGTLEMNFVPEYDSEEFDIVKILIPIFKTKRVNKNGLELMNCIRTVSDIAIPTKNVDMGNFIPTNTPYLVNRFGIKSKNNSGSDKDFDLNVGLFIFTSSDIHLDDNILQPNYLNLLNTFADIDIGYHVDDDISQEEAVAWSSSGIILTSQEKNCREVHYEGETLAHSTNKNGESPLKKIPLEERIGNLMKSPLGLQVVIFIAFSILLFIYKLSMGALVSTIGETTETKSNLFTSMSKAGTHSSIGAWILFGIFFIVFFILMKDDWLTEIKI
tara:strand:+ start:1216 stop:2394 length:1179 start_codon:yes stop_codon:yes gene_type:complete